MIACKLSKNNAFEHFVEFNKTIDMPKDATKEAVDYKLSRYACYLIVQNANCKKKVIALGQTYFAFQTRKQEISEEEFLELSEDVLDKKKIKTEEVACGTHYRVGKAVRNEIEEIGGTMPEKLPIPEKSVKELGREELLRLSNK